jgi:hypothetical protein
VQTSLLYGALTFLKHSAECTQISSQKFFLTKFSHVPLAMTIYLLCVEILFRFGDIETFLGVTFTASTTQLLPFFALIPVLWLHMIRFPDLFLIKAMPILIALQIILRIESRTALILYLFTTFFGCLYIFLTKSTPLNLRAKMVAQIVIAIGFVILIHWDKFFRLLSDSFISGKTRRLDTGVIEIVDLDRMLHLKVAVEVITQSCNEFLLGFGFRESSFVLAKPLLDVYRIQLRHLNFENELGSFTNVSTFGISALLVDFGFIGIGLMTILVLVQIKKLPWKLDLGWSILRTTSLFSLFSFLYATNFTHSAYFFAAVFFGELLDFLVMEHRTPESAQTPN